jgi:uncharacterized protein YlbG (UPF0298 family)
MKKSEILGQNPQGKMTKNHVSGIHYIDFENGVSFLFVNRKQMETTWNKLIKMGFLRDLNLSSDEFKGLSESKPSETFNYKILQGK